MLRSVLEAADIVQYNQAMRVWTGRMRLVLAVAIAAAALGHHILMVTSDSVGYGELEARLNE